MTEVCAFMSQSLCDKTPENCKTIIIILKIHGFVVMDIIKQQDLEYEESLRQDIERERLEALLEESLKEKTILESKQIFNTQADQKDEELCEEEEENPLSPDSLRNMRLKFFCPQQIEKKRAKNEVETCVAVTQKGNRCKKKAYDSEYCSFHAKNSLLW
jgi:hypothetical protein